MKTFCRYLLIDIQTGFALCAGDKYKDFDNSTMRYINNGTFRFGLSPLYNGKNGNFGSSVTVGVKPYSIPNISQK